MCNYRKTHIISLYIFCQLLVSGVIESQVTIRGKVMDTTDLWTKYDLLDAYKLIKFDRDIYLDPTWAGIETDEGDKTQGIRALGNRTLHYFCRYHNVRKHKGEYGVDSTSHERLVIYDMRRKRILNEVKFTDLFKENTEEKRLVFWGARYWYEEQGWPVRSVEDPSEIKYWNISLASMTTNDRLFAITYVIEKRANKDMPVDVESAVLIIDTTTKVIRSFKVEGEIFTLEMTLDGEYLGYTYTPNNLLIKRNQEAFGIYGLKEDSVIYKETFSSEHSGTVIIANRRYHTNNPSFFGLHIAKGADKCSLHKYFLLEKRQLLTRFITPMERHSIYSDTTSMGKMLPDLIEEWDISNF